VEEHARRRAPIVQLADRISGRFVAAVLVLAAVTLLVWLRLDPARALDHAVALLIVTCPCALGLATPLAMSAAVGQAARAGFLIKGADVLEKLTRPGRMWLDKTGTLTAGRTTLLQWHGEESVKPLVAAAEAHSSHPIARALVAALGAPLGVPSVEIVETPGGGVEARVGRRAVLVGAPDFIIARIGAGAGALADAVDRMIAEGLTPVLIAVDGAAVAAAGFGDPLREDAVSALARVRALGWRVGMLSGDHPAVVAATGRRTGIDPGACLGAVTPEEKLRLVETARAREPVVMIGDGVNDAAALAAASVGVAVHGGAEAALHAADVFVTRPGVARIAELLDGAHRAMRVVRRNLTISLVYNVTGVCLAMSGLLNPLLAAILMPLSSLTVIMSSYRARTFRAPADRESGR
jgi:Cu2+-exporting ATPase